MRRRGRPGQPRPGRPGQQRGLRPHRSPAGRAVPRADRLWRLTPTTSMPFGARFGTFPTGTMAFVNPCFAAAAMRSVPNRTGRISPARPISPKHTSRSGAARSRKLDTIASKMGKSTAVSPIRKPPTTLMKTSSSLTARLPCFWSTASNSARRF